MASREDYRLRVMEEGDLEQVLEWRNSDRVRANMYTDQIISLDNHRAWFARLAGDTRSDYRVLEYRGKIVGVANAVQIDPANRKCFWAFYMGETEVPKGSGAVLELLFLEHLFGTLGMHKVCCEVFTFNETTIKLHKKFGFVQEGLYVDHIWKNGRFEDAVALALFEDKWQARREQMEKLCFRGAAKADQ